MLHSASHINYEIIRSGRAGLLHCDFAGTSRPAITSDEPELGEADGGVANVYYQSNAQARNSPADYLGEGCGWWLSPGAG